MRGLYPWCSIWRSWRLSSSTLVLSSLLAWSRARLLYYDSAVCLVDNMHFALAALGNVLLPLSILSSCMDHAVLFRAKSVGCFSWTVVDSIAAHDGNNIAASSASRLLSCIHPITACASILLQAQMVTPHRAVPAD